MVGTVLGEFSFMPALSEEEKADAALIDSMIEKRYGAEGNYVAGANIAGFEKVANAMIAQGIV